MSFLVITLGLVPALSLASTGKVLFFFPDFGFLIYKIYDGAGKRWISQGMFCFPLYLCIHV